MKKKILYLLLVTILFPVDLLAQNYSTAFDYYRLKAATIARRGTMDFRFSSSFQSTELPFRVPTAELDTNIVLGPSTLADLQWSLNYAWNNNWEGSISVNAFYDANEGIFRYGAGDTKAALKFASPSADAQFKWAAEAYLTLPTGFDDGDRIVRSYAIGKSSWGTNFLADITWNTWSAKFNGGYFQGEGTVEMIEDPDNTFWYTNLTGVAGITPSGAVINSSQANIGLGLGRNFLFGTKAFVEYTSNTVFAEQGEGRSVGNISFGLNAREWGGNKISIGADMPLGSQRPGMGIFLNLRMNGLIGGRRLIIQPTPTVLDEEPTLAPGAKPFFSREGLVYARVRQPINDTVIIMDATPSMIGRGIAGVSGEEVTTGVVDFIQELIDSTSNNSNFSLITFNDELTSLSWRNVDQSKKEEIKNSVRDVPDEMNTKATAMANTAGTYQWRELLEQSIQRAYEELDAFQKSDYNKTHLQRIIIFSDGIDESSLPHSLDVGFNSIIRRYLLNRDDYRYFYYVHTNPNTEGARIDDNIINFVEQEDGKLYRSTDIANVDSTFLRSLNFNGVETSASLRYQSQITKMAVLDFNTGGVGNIQEFLLEAFKSVFEFNEYFVITPQNEVRNIMASEGVSSDRKIDQRQIQRLGKRLGGDYVVYGEVVQSNVERGKGLFVPYLFGLPKTEMSIEVAVQLISVSDGTLAYVGKISATSSNRGGVRLFPTSRDNKLSQLSGLELVSLQKKLMGNWADRLRASMFEDRSIIIDQND